MSFILEYQSLIKRIDQAIELPAIKQILLPDPTDSDDMKDNFGFVILSDGSAGPFYSCLGDTLTWLNEHRNHFIGQSPIKVAVKLDGLAIPASALALGAFNAISQHIMKRAGFNPCAITKRSDTDLTAGHIGLVGFFGPLVERYIAQGKQITIIEQQPECVPADLPIQLYTSPEALAACDYILCTASTLINNTIESIVDAAGDPAKINLIGPSASGLPDLLFAMGIHSTGGFSVDNLDELIHSVLQGDSWGTSGRKYQLTREVYPGVDLLLKQMRQNANQS